MSTDRPKDNAGKNKPAPQKAAPAKPATPAPAPAPIPQVAPLFRNMDWLTLGITTLLVFIGYFLTVAPDVTLEDSGELSVGSYYAAVPHPPGYPFWSIFTYLFLNIYRVGNIAYRVAVASALCGAVASGLLGMLVSRGSSMILEGIAEFKELPKRLESAICVVSGMTSGLLLAYNGYMWSQCVIVEVYPISVLSLMVAYCFLLRWMYAPHQRRYIYLSWFVLGLGFTNHQTLLLTTMGLEVAVIAAQPKLGRELLLGNAVCYLLGLVAITGHMMGAFEMSPMVLVIFHIVGVASIIGCIWLAIMTKGLGSEWRALLAMFGCWGLGAAVFFYMPITSMTNPPMNWGYPRTWDGFIHAFTRGQYEKISPTDFIQDPLRLVSQMGMYCAWVQDEFNLVNIVLIIVPILFFFRMQKRERSWLIGLTGFWFCLAIVLLVLLNPNFDRASRDLNKVFFASSYTVLAMFIGYGLSLVAALLATQYQRFRLWALGGGGVVVTLAVITLYLTTQDFVPNDDGGGLASMMHVISRSFAPYQYGLPIYGDLLLVGLALLFVLSLVNRTKAQMGVVLVIFALLPVRSITAHWADNEERHHWFGYWFGHDMFTPPFGIYPEMTRSAVLFGGTDPGRFCPTYMIFDESIIPHDKQPKEDQKFDRRDVYIITQNALADPTYLEYIRAHYNRSTQIDPPFFQEMLRSKKEIEENYTTNIIARIAYQLLDKPFTALGARVEARRRAEHIYPPEEIHTPSLEEHGRAFQDYLGDAQRRLDHDMRFTNEPKQIKQGEDVHLTPGSSQVSVSGQVAVMSINGLLTKDIFDANPTHEFFVEESFPLDWMYPYETPFGVIMKINRQPLDEIPQDAIDKDHKFWSLYSQRLTGNWITYDTPVKDIAAFVEKVYLERNFAGFTGDQAFIRDDQAQKSFSKLRSSIGGIYDWRFHHAKTAADQQRMLKEADFALRQAFAFCPYSPEAVFRYVNLLLTMQRLDDAAIVAKTCHRLDPNNPGVTDLVKQLDAYKAQRDAAGLAPQVSDMTKLEQEYTNHSTNFQNSFNLAGAYLQTGQKDKALAILDGILTNTNTDVQALIVLAQAYAQLTNFPKLELTLEKVVQVQPHSPEAWCDLAALKAVVGKQAEALTDLKRSLDENTLRLAQNPGASNLLGRIRTDPRLVSLHNLPEYQKMVGPQ